MNAIKIMLILSILVLTACQSQRNNSGNHFATPLMQSEQSLPELSEVLLYRSQICQSDADKQEQWLQQYRTIDKRWAELERLIIASCRPDMTPGILKNQLVKLKKQDKWPSDYKALFALMSAQLNALNNSVEQKQQTIDQLNKTIEALTRIEQDLESRER
jgi:hypothetical protein